MASRPLYEHVKGVIDIVDINRKIRAEVRRARTRPRLMELRLRSAYLYTLSESPAWVRHFDSRIGAIKNAAKNEYHKTATFINAKIKKRGLGELIDTRLGRGK